MSSKLFISQPMNGIDEVSILETRELIFKTMQTINPDIELLETYVRDDAPEDAGRLWYLGRSIQDLGKADLVIFAKGWTRSNGCVVEHLACELYHIPYIDWDKTTEGLVKYMLSEVDKLDKEEN